MDEIIAIRADGNSDIGFGHIIRTQALARKLEKQGANVIFLTNNPENISEFKTINLSSPGFHLSEDEDAYVAVLLKDIEASMLVIDSYAYDQERLDRMGRLDLLTVYIDDMNRHPFNINYVVNGNLYASRLDYRGEAEFLLGSEYLLIREEFVGLPHRNLCLQVQNVLITFGAADMENITPHMLKVLTEYHRFQNICWHIMIGPAFQNADEIEYLARGRENVRVYRQPNVKNLMNKCDISISAAGSTTYELAACGVPAVLVVTADNQLLLAEEAAQQGLALNLRWYHQLQVQDLYKSLDLLMDNSNLRNTMTERGQSLIDGRGAERLAKVLLEAVRRRANG